MAQPDPASSPLYGLLPTQIEGFDSLAELALDSRWSWDHGADVVWKQLDDTLWELTRNPWVVLQTVAPEKLELLLASPAFRRQVDVLLQDEKAAAATAWFQQKHPNSPLTCVA